MKTTIYLVRHAEAEGNLCRRMHGQYNSNLTARGLRQLVDLQKRFENIHVDACYSSDLIRAANTAMAVCIPNGLEYRVDPGFREVCIGIWEDVSFGYLNTFHGLKMIQFGRDQVNWVVEGSETYRQYTTRFLESMENAALRHKGGSIAIVSHSIVMKAVLKELFPDMKIPHSANTAVSCLEYENGTYSVVYLNDSSHMDASLYTRRAEGGHLLVPGGLDRHRHRCASFAHRPDRHGGSEAGWSHLYDGRERRRGCCGFPGVDPGVSRL